MYELQE